MYNQSDLYDWKPLMFEDLSSNSRSRSSTSKISKGKNSNKSKLQSEISDVDPVANEYDFEQLKEEIKAQAYQEGFNLGKEEGFAAGKDLGYEQGYQKGQQEGREYIEQQLNEEKLNTVQTIKELITNFKQSIDDIDELVAPKLIELALLAAQKTVGSIPEVKQKQLEHILKMLIEHCSLLSGSISLHVNPDDFVWLEPMFGEEIKQHNWQVIADSDIESGGCKMFTETNEIDASTVDHWQIMSDSLLEGGDNH